MKPVNEMTMSEIEFLLHTHEFSSEIERVRALECFVELRRIVDFIEARVLAYVALPCDCAYCDSIRNAKPKRAPKAPKEKTPPVHFSLD